MGSIYSGHAGVHPLDRGRHRARDHRGGRPWLSRSQPEHLRQYHFYREHCGLLHRPRRGVHRLQVRDTTLEGGL